DGDDAIVCVVPEGVAAGALDRWTEGEVPHSGQSITRGRLVVAGIPFLAQDDYDRLLWASDINFVRGEDSFARAQWAMRPFVWNAYAQSGNAHALKLDAFLARYADGLAPGAAAALFSFSRAWNDGGDREPTVGALWPALVHAHSALDEHARTWARALATQTDLASALVKFVSDRV
ncbi:MAG TPA: elongation factor P maturation arginine rhamnosyltransferase EarP, partial [Casimicrobiaceae bacterium]